MKQITVLLLGALAGSGLFGQEVRNSGRDFLSEYEVDLIREAQDPNDRLVQYIQFAKLRLELVDQKLQEDGDARSIDIHRNLSDYGRIIETMDLIIDDALADGKDVAKGLDAVVSQEGVFIAQLRKVQASDPKDLHRYQFVLEDAIEMTQDSLELAMEDSGKRTKEVKAADKAAQEKLEQTMSSQRAKDIAKTKGETERKEAEYNRKRPTLRKPGEEAPKPR